jgi:hypothetical protein
MFGQCGGSVERPAFTFQKQIGWFRFKVLISLSLYIPYDTIALEVTRSSTCCSTEFVVIYCLS